MTRKPHRVPGMSVVRDRQPLCSVHRTPCQRNDLGEWFCPECFNDYATEIIQARTGNKTASGIELPHGAIDPAKEKDKINMRQVLPNRQQRRAMRRK